MDVTIAFDDGQMDAHKIILSAASPLIKDLLCRNPGKQSLLFLRGTRKRDIEALLEFIYSGKTKINENELTSFMELANSLEVEGLQLKTENKNSNFSLERKKIPKQTSVKEFGTVQQPPVVKMDDESSLIYYNNAEPDEEVKHNPLDLIDETPANHSSGHIEKLNDVHRKDISDFSGDALNPIIEGDQSLTSYQYEDQIRYGDYEHVEKTRY